uniref:Uncharacterized protein n=1 Tax=Anguilla anguilla TaxID=7936 RepID=A0A0E9R0Q9_ANGAN
MNISLRGRSLMLIPEQVCKGSGCDPIYLLPSGADQANHTRHSSAVNEVPLT